MFVPRLSSRMITPITCMLSSYMFYSNFSTVSAAPLTKSEFTDYLVTNINKTGLNTVIFKIQMDKDQIEIPTSSCVSLAHDAVIKKDDTLNSKPYTPLKNKVNPF